MDRMMEDNIERAKEMQKRMLDMQEELYNERGEQIERLNKKKEELSAAGTKVHYEAAASGIKEGLEKLMRRQNIAVSAVPSSSLIH